MLWRQLVRFLAHRLVLHDGANGPSGQEFPKEEVANELHVCWDALLARAQFELDLVDFQANGPLIRELQRIGLHGFELVQTDVEECRLKCSRELRHRVENEDEVGVGLAVVRLCERLLHDQPDHNPELLHVREHGIDNLLRDSHEVLRADLVQKALHAALELHMGSMGAVSGS
eukprot:6997854-Heterocapsa_arctica.AAC.1